MSPASIREPAKAPVADPHRQAERDPVAIAPGRPAGPATGTRKAGAAVTGLARRLRALPASMDLRQLAGPAAVFFLWPPRRVPLTKVSPAPASTSRRLQTASRR